MNSGPLSNRTYAGAPRAAASRSRVATTATASMERSTTMAGHSRVNSSMTLSSFRVRPSTVTSNWKSIAHRAFGRIGHIAPTWAPDAGEAFLAPLVGHLQAFTTPQAPHPLVVDLPAGPAGVLRRSAPPPALASPGELTQELA